MLWISLGERCNVKYQIDHHVGKNETLLFDWLGTSMHSVIELLSGRQPIESYVQLDQLIIRTPFVDQETKTKQQQQQEKPKVRIQLAGLDKCVSIHDVPVDYTESDLYLFADQFKRRFARLLRHIRSNRPLCFVRYSHQHITADERDQFDQVIRRIHPHCNYRLVSVCSLFCVDPHNPNKDQDKDKQTQPTNQLQVSHDKTFYQMDLVMISDANPTNLWTTSHLDWAFVFSQHN